MKLCVPNVVKNTNVKLFNLVSRINETLHIEWHEPYIGYITIKYLDYVNFHSVNPLYFIIDKVDGYIEESNENKYSFSASTDKNKEVLIKYTKRWNKTKSLIER